MANFLRTSGAMMAVALAVTSCAIKAPVAAIDPSTPVTRQLTQAAPGNVTVPVAFPALDERTSQYVYNRNYVNTIEVRLRDSLGNESIQYVARNAYLAGSKAAGTVNLTFFNVMPGVFTLTVRTSHLRLLSADGPIQYDGVRDVFFVDGNSNHTYESTDTETPLMAGTTRTSNFLIFSGSNFDGSAAFPDDLRADSTTTASGFGVGAGTASVIPGQTQTVTATVGTLAQWPSNYQGSQYTVSAGDTVNMPVANIFDVQAVDQVALIAPEVNLLGGIFNIGLSNVQMYPKITDVGAATISFTPTRTTNPTPGADPTAWPMWLSRGQAYTEWGFNANLPKLTVIPDMVLDTASRIFVNTPDISAGSTGTVQYDLRDQYGNPVAGNVTNVNTVSLAGVRGRNAGVTMDYWVTSYRTDNDPRISYGTKQPFFVPGKTCGTMNGASYVQGSVAPGPISTAATYSIRTGDNEGWRLLRLAVPEHIYRASSANFSGTPSANAPHDYRLTISEDPGNGSKYWVTFERMSGPTAIASDSFTTSVLKSGAQISLKACMPTGVSPAVVGPDSLPVTIQCPSPLDVTNSTDQTTIFHVSDYGARQVGDFDNVKVRVLDKNQAYFMKDVGFNWLK